MKFVFTTILLTSLITAQAQHLYVGSFLGYSHSTYSAFNYDTKQEQKFTTDFLYFSLPVGYKINSWLVETGGTYDGNAYIDLMAGKRIQFTKSLSADLLAGVADNVSFFPRQEVKSKVSARINYKFLSVQSSYVNKTFQIGIGLFGFVDD